MSNLILFGNRSHKYLEKKPKKKHRFRNFLLVFLTVILCFECLYFWLCYTGNSFVTYWRNTYIQTALTTMSHQWLAKDLLPARLVNKTIEQIKEGQKQQESLNSSWDLPPVEKPPVEPTPVVDKEPDEEDTTSIWIRQDREGAEAFFELFDEIDPQSMLSYLDAHPDTMKTGKWADIQIDEAGLDQEGTDIYTINGHQVLALDVPNQLVLLRVGESSWRGILAICKDPARLGMRWSDGIGSYGQTAKTICNNYGGVLAVSASGFHDPNGTGNGSIVSGYGMANGKGIQGTVSGYGYKRIEMHTDNRLYIKSATAPITDDMTDSAEFTPALIVDGTMVVDESTDWNGNQPRTVMGQGRDGEVFLLVVEGRRAPISIGVSVVDCAELIYEYGAVQGMNLDGGTTSVMFYNGRTITLCANPDLTDGRTLPNAWIYFPAGTEA